MAHSERRTHAARPLAALAGALLLAACATPRDHFYVLRAVPAEPAAMRAAQPLIVRLDLTIPALVDRPQMLVGTSGGGVAVLDHERWAAPLSDLVSSTLARDIERRRADVWVGDRRLERSARGAVVVQVDIVDMMARRGAAAPIEAPWRIPHPRHRHHPEPRRGFAAPHARDGYEAVAQAFSEALGALAQRLAAALPAP